MINKNKIIIYCDKAIFTCMCLLIFCLPFAKAGMETFTWLAIFLWLFKRVIGYRAGSLWRMFPKTELNQALGIFIVFNVLSVIFTSHFGLSLRGFFGKELKFLAIYFMLVEVINRKERLRVSLFTIIGSAVLITVDAGAQLFKGKDFLRGYPLDTFSASFNVASGFAGWLIVIILLLLGIILSEVISNRKLKILLIIIAAIQFLYLLRTYCRGAWLGLVISISMMFYYFMKFSSSKIKLLYLCASICFLSVYLLLPHSIILNVKDAIRVKLKFGLTISERINTMPQTAPRSNFERIMWWKEALRIIRDYPTGCGLNTYSVVARNYKSFDGGGVYPHNSYLQMTAETGLFGLFAFFVVIFIFFKTGLRYFNQKKDYLALGLLAGILAFLVQAFFDTHLYSLQLVVLFWYMLGLTMAVVKLGNNSDQDPGGIK